MIELVLIIVNFIILFFILFVLMKNSKKIVNYFKLGITDSGKLKAMNVIVFLGIVSLWLGVFGKMFFVPSIISLILGVFVIFLVALPER